MMMSTFCLDVFKFIKSTQPINKSRVQKNFHFNFILALYDAALYIHGKPLDFRVPGAQERRSPEAPKLEDKTPVSV